MRPHYVLSAHQLPHVPSLPVTFLRPPNTVLQLGQARTGGDTDWSHQYGSGSSAFVGLTVAISIEALLAVFVWGVWRFVA